MRQDAEHLARLARIAALRREQELAKLAGAAQTRARLMAALGALDPVPAPLDGDPALIRARLAHAAWIEGRRRMLNQRLAAATADWLTCRPPAARAFGQADVLARLAAQARKARPGSTDAPSEF